MKPTLFVMCGPSHVGKSSLVEGLPAVLISPDAIRRRLGLRFSREDRFVWALVRFVKLKTIQHRQDVVLDACHMSPAARKHAVEGAEGYRKVCVIVEAGLQTVEARARKSGRVPIDEVRRMHKAYRRPTLEELSELGFDEVQVVETQP